MNKEKQRIAIALAHTGTRYQWLEAEELFFRVNANDSLTQETPKDYLNDLNAMHEAEKVLTDEQLADMAETLGVDADDAPADSWRLLLRATAAQRAEAFLKTIFKWEQSK